MALEIGPLLVQLMTGFIIVGAWSYLYKGVNPIYRIIEVSAVGIFLGFGWYLALDVLNKQIVIPIQNGNIAAVFIPLVLGLLLYTRFSPKTAWISRWPTAVITGIGLGIAVQALPKAQILAQLKVGSWVGPTPLAAFSNIIYTVALFSTLSFFIFTVKQKGVVGSVAKVGRFFMIIAFGAILGGFLMTNIAAPIGNAGDLMQTTGGQIVTVVAIIVLVISILYDRSRNRKVV